MSFVTKGGDSYVTGELLFAEDSARSGVEALLEGQSFDVPMTQLVDRIVAEELGRYRTKRSNKGQSGGDKQLTFNF